MLVCDSVLVGRACWVLSVFVCGCCQAVSNIVCTSYVFRPRSTHTGAPRARARARVARLGCVGFVCGAGARVLRVCAGRACKLCFPVAGKACACAMRAQRVGTPTRVGGRVGTAMLLCGDACVLLVLVCDRVLVGCTSCAGVCVRIVRVWALSSGSQHYVFKMCFRPCRAITRGVGGTRRLGLLMFRGCGRERRGFNLRCIYCAFGTRSTRARHRPAGAPRYHRPCVRGGRVRVAGTRVCPRACSRCP